MGGEQATAVFFRIASEKDPPLEDFASAAEKEPDQPPPDDPELAGLWDGVSVFATEAQARSHTRGRRPVPGKFIAALELPVDGSIPLIRIERTLRSRGHYTIWAAKELLREKVFLVVPV